MMIWILSAIGLACGIVAWRGMPRERARDEKGRFVADDPKTLLTDEAWRRKK
jgi:hypothetical protein